MRAMRRGATLGAIVILAALLAGCGRNPTFSYVSPDYAVLLVVEPETPSGPKAGVRNQVYLRGARTPGDDGRWPERVPIGSFVGGWSPASVAWIDTTTVNVCPLNSAADAARQASVTVGEDGARRAYRVTTDCDRVRRAPPSPGAPNGAQQRPAG